MTPNGLRTYQRMTRLRNWLFTTLIRRAFAQFGRNSIVVPPATVYGPANIAIGNGVYLGPGCELMVARTTDADVRITVGDGVSMSGRCTISAVADVTIERDVLMARNVYISDHNHGYEDSSIPVKRQPVSKVAAVCVGAGAWLGQNVVITPGVTIGAGAVVAANSVVRSDVPACSLAAGVPARVIRSWEPA